MRKAFSTTLHGKYDDIARQVTMHCMERKGYKMRENPNIYAQDLIAEKDGNKFYVECEVKTVWKGDAFPYDTVQLPERKKKFFSKPTLFFIWNNDMTTAATFKSETIKDLTPVEVSNKYMASGEMFYQIPMDMIRFARYTHETNT